MRKNQPKGIRTKPENKPPEAKTKQEERLNKRFNVSIYIKFLLVFLVSILPYISTLHYPFAYMDDNLIVLMQEKLLAEADVKKAFQSEFFNQDDEVDFFYRPVQTLTLMLDYQLAGTEMLQYRLTGILLHALVAVTLMFFLSAFGVSGDVSFLLSLLFAAHPAMAPVQLFIAARADSLVALFLMLSILGLLQYTKSGNILWLIAHFVVFCLAIFTKETGVFLPLLAGLFILIYPPLAGRRRTMLWRFAPVWFLIGVLWFLLRKAALTNPPVVDTGILVSQFFENLPGIVIYIGVLFAPFSLPSILKLNSPYELVGVVAVLLLAVALIRKRITVPRYILWFSAAWYCFFVLVSFLSPSNLPLFDYLLNRTYVPSIGLFLLIGYVLDRLSIPHSRLLLFTVLCLPLFIFLNVGYTSKYSDRISTWNTFAKEAPDSYHVLKHQLLAYEDAKLQAEVPDLYLKAAQLAPGDKNVNYSAGAVLYKQGRKEEAFRLFQRELAINPTHAENLNYIGVYYEDRKQLKEAKAYYLKSVAADSSCKSCLWNSARACAMTADRAQGRRFIKRMHTLDYPIPVKAVEEYLFKTK